MEFGWLKIYSYGFFVALGILVAFVVGLFKARQKGVNEDDFYNLGFFILFPAIIGSRLAYVFSHWDYFSDNPMRIFYVWEGGLASFGGIFAAILGSLIYIRWKKLDFYDLADSVSYSLPLGFAIGRIGCFLNGCCYGVASNLPIAVTFKALGDNTSRLPTQLFESLYTLMIFLLLVFIDKRYESKGLIFFSSIGLYGFFRFLNEFLRVNPPVIAGLSGSQIGSALLVISALIYFVKNKGGIRRKTGNVQRS
ncbi:MAG: prolipoprotein diacylglyceryl transferase [Actinobacteria bacterium]|nr:prolipoprotein diacylglyceryl transferase [Actinomycetota bacterium]